MKFTDFLDIYGDDCQSAMKRTTFEQEVVSFVKFVRLYHKAVKLGLIQDDASVFMNIFNVNFDFNLDTPEDMERFKAGTYKWPWQRGEVWP